MRKEAAAALGLILLLVIAQWNIRAVDRLTGQILTRLERSEQALEAGSPGVARRELDTALELWLSADGYTHIFLRHAEIDAASDAFYELHEKLNEAAPESCSPVYDKLRYHLESIAAMEHVSLRSVL